MTPMGFEPPNAISKKNIGREHGEDYYIRRLHRINEMLKKEKSKSSIKGDGIHWRDAHQEFVLGEMAIVNESEIDTSKTWEEVNWDQIKEEMARRALESCKINGSSIMDEKLKCMFLLCLTIGDTGSPSGKLRFATDKYLKEASLKWDEFYKLNKGNFFKDRNYLNRSFPELVSSSDCKGKIVLEVGSGVGNTLYPLIKMNPNNYYYAFDCSPCAIEILNSRKQPDDSNKFFAFICDIVNEDIPDDIIPNETVDLVTMIFFLSSIDPDATDNVIKRICAKTKFGGMVLFRDYGIYDMTQMRFFAKKINNKLDQNLYCRGDGTLSYFFELNKVEELFNRNGFETVSKRYDTRTLTNRKRKIRMYRVWVEGKFMKVGKS